MTAPETSALLLPALGQLPSGLIIAEAPTGRVVLVNDRAREVLDLKDGNIPAFCMPRAWHLDGSPCTLKQWPLHRAITGREEIRRMELLVENATGKHETLGASAMPVLDTGGQVIAGAMTLQDISEVKRIEQARARRSEEALAADQAKSMLLDIVAHELRSPLQAIQTALQILEQPDATERARVAARRIAQRSASRQARILADLGDLARIRRGKLHLEPRQGDLAPLLVTLAEEAGDECRRRGLQLALDLPEDPLPVHHDTVRIHQVLDNLLGNAFKFTGAGGTVTLGARLDFPWAVVTIADTGCGFRPEVLARLFEPFFQATPGSPHQGMGIGLAVARALVEAHGGHLSASSAGPGRGSQFAVRLPLSEPCGAGERPTVRRPEPRPPAVYQPVADPQTPQGGPG